MITEVLHNERALSMLTKQQAIEIVGAETVERIDSHLFDTSDCIELPNGTTHIKTVCLTDKHRLTSHAFVNTAAFDEDYDSVDMTPHYFTIEAIARNGVVYRQDGNVIHIIR